MTNCAETKVTPFDINATSNFGGESDWVLGRSVDDMSLYRCCHTPNQVSVDDDNPDDIVISTAPKSVKFNARVLLVEDNHINQLVAKKMFEEFGLDVVVANNGREAVECFKNDKSIDLVFMDCQMPEMDGYEATSIIRRLENNDGNSATNTHLPIIALTAHAMGVHIEQCYSVGMDSVLTKPFEFSDLQRILENYLGSKIVVNDSFVQSDIM